MNISRGQTATFSVKHADLGHIKNCWIGAVKGVTKDSTKKKASDEKWHCQKITIEDTANDERYNNSYRVPISISFY